MARDMHELAAKAQEVIPDSYSLSLEQVVELTARARSLDREESIRAISDAFYYGFAMGCRASQNGRVKRL